MKKSTWALLIMLFIAVTLVSGCKKEGDEVMVKIGGEKITLDQFNNYYYMFAKMMLNMDKKEVDKMAANPEIENHPTLNLLNKKKFMDFLISRKLLSNKAFSDESMNKKDLETIRELAELQFVSSYYLSQKLKDDIKVTDEEKNNFYNRNKERLKGVPVNEEVDNWIKQQVFMEKLEIKSNEFILELLGEAGVNKEGFKKYLAKIEKGTDKKEEPKEEKKADKKAEKK
ncbi:MAG TPA: SurA N-terminal domain-containing protein [Spirochaetota bacterium]|nr:SurA N-terminal domain-containing protein [Spirochaetota bacterium]HPC42111.1 SurA N-terminal domain-containing protein [Spirochaetota bacterium]HPL16756.1 SurA N-terminal domain-containing protein [Spirochaetota bacterium]HQF09065.1 SurA N-terminal domain-containing protein [Spirochaetota bacterium]HQH97953.1 SurA N-terminal domain-containing protein [Spirochaetota bacterium]